MKCLILAAVLWANGSGNIITIYNTDQESADFGTPPSGVVSLNIDTDANAALLANLKTNPLPRTLTNSVIKIGSTTQVVANVTAGSSQFLFNVITNRLKTSFARTVTSPNDLRAQLPAILVQCDQTNTLGTAGAMSKANGVLFPILQLQILQNNK